MNRPSELLINGGTMLIICCLSSATKSVAPGFVGLGLFRFSHKRMVGLSGERAEGSGLSHRGEAPGRAETGIIGAWANLVSCKVWERALAASLMCFPLFCSGRRSIF